MREQNPGRRIVPKIVLGLIVIDGGQFVMEMAGEIEHDRLEIEVMIGDMDGNNAVGLEMALVNVERFFGQQMDGNGIAAERIQGQQIELLRGLAYHRETRVAHGDFDLPSTPSEVSKAGGSQAFDFRIDFIDAQVISGLAVGGESAGAEADQPEAPVSSRQRAPG